MEFKFLDKSRILAAQIFGQSFKYLVEKYNQSRNMLTPASPFTQILHVVSEISELIFMYLENALSELNILKAKNRDSVYGMARLTGHNPCRGISAFGKVGLKLKPGSEKEFTGDYFIIPSYTRLTCLNNSLQYFLLFDQDYIVMSKDSNEIQYGQIIQGQVESQTFISKGKKLDSFSVQTKDLTDHFNVKVYVNGTLYQNYEGLYDMNAETKGVIVKTGITGGLDIYFGNGSFGVIPPKGAKIEIVYIRTRGGSGNIPSNADVVLTYDDIGYDKFNEEVDLNETILTMIEMSPSFGSDAETLNFTRLIAPKVSKAMVLVHPENYIYFLSKYNYFSIIDAYTTFNDEYLDDDNVIYLYLLPDINKKLTSDTDYFIIDESEFTLNSQEINFIKTTLTENGGQATSTELIFIEPIIKRYNLNIILRYFDKPGKEYIEGELRSRLNEYFLNIKRRDKIPRSDIVALAENVEGVDSVNVTFVSQENEEAITNGYYMKTVWGFDSVTRLRKIVSQEKVTLAVGEDPNLGLDEFGDILIKERELPIIRGNWYDRNGKFYETYPETGKLSSLNIIFKEEIKLDLYNKMNQDKLTELQKNKYKKLK